MQFKEITQKAGFKWGVLTAILSLLGIFIAGAMHSGRDGAAIAWDLVRLAAGCAVAYGIWRYARHRAPDEHPVVIHSAEPGQIRQWRARLADLQHELDDAERERRQLAQQYHALERTARQDRAALQHWVEIATSREQECQAALQQCDHWRSQAEALTGQLAARQVMKWQQAIELLRWARATERLTVRKTRDTLRALGVPIPEGEMRTFSVSVRALPPLPHQEAAPPATKLQATDAGRGDGRTDGRRTDARAALRTQPRRTRRGAR